MHLSIFILIINQIDEQNLFYKKYISCLYMFRAPCAHRQEVKIVLYSLWYHHTYRLYSVWYHQNYRCDDTNFDPLTMCTWCSKHVETWNKLIVKQILCIKLVDYYDKKEVPRFLKFERTVRYNWTHTHTRTHTHTQTHTHTHTPLSCPPVITLGSHLFKHVVYKQNTSSTACIT